MHQTINIGVDQLEGEGHGYTGKHIGPKEKIGNKGGGLSNRLRAVLG